MQPPGSRIYEVRAEHDGKVHSRGARRNRADAELRLLEALEHAKRNGLDDMRFWIEEVDTSGLFEIPPRPTPRERFTTRVVTTSQPHAWRTVHVDVLDGEAIVASYDRNYGMLQTFEPFRQGERMFALIAPSYTATAVMDLQTGQIVAAEEPSAGGFCPVGFYVPDWWDVNDGETLPGSWWWRSEDHEWPVGDFGFVWGCVWGDDSSWKVQYLDLSRVQEGVLRRDDRFGYLRLSSHPELEPREFIRCTSWEGARHVRFDVPQTFVLDTGARFPDDDL